jgi:hypothetical protein
MHRFDAPGRGRRDSSQPIRVRGDLARQAQGLEQRDLGGRSHLDTSGGHDLFRYAHVPRQRLVPVLTVLVGVRGRNGRRVLVGVRVGSGTLAA